MYCKWPMHSDTWTEPLYCNSTLLKICIITKHYTLIIQAKEAMLSHECISPHLINAWFVFSTKSLALSLTLS